MSENNIEPLYEPEWCEDCVEEMESSGIEYTFDYHSDGSGGWVCDHCGRPL